MPESDLAGSLTHGGPTEGQNGSPERYKSTKNNLTKACVYGIGATAAHNNACVLVSRSSDTV